MVKIAPVGDSLARNGPFALSIYHIVLHRGYITRAVPLQSKRLGKTREINARNIAFPAIIGSIPGLYPYSGHIRGAIPCPALRSPCPALPCPALPCPTLALPCPTLALPCPALRSPCPALRSPWYLAARNGLSFPGQESRFSNPFNPPREKERAGWNAKANFAPHVFLGLEIVKSSLKLNPN